MRFVAIFFLLTITGVASATGQAPRPDPQWTRFEVWLWTFGNRPLTARFFDTLRETGVTGINREEGADACAVRGAGLSFYVGHAVGKRVLHLRKDAFDRCWNRHWADRDRASLVRPHCLNDPAVAERLRARLQKTLEAALDDGPRAISLGDEISVTRRVTPIDFSFSPSALAAFRKWLERRYDSLDALNRRWRTRFDTWADVFPYTADEIKRRERRMPRHRWALAPWSDHRAFTDWTLAKLLGDLRAEARRLGATAPVGFLGGQAPAPYGGYDWSRLLGVVDWVEVYDEGGAMEVVRGLAPDVIRVRTYFPYGGAEGRNRFRLWKYFAHGDRGAILWSSEKFLDGEDAPTAYARAIGPTLRALSGDVCTRLLALPFADDGVAVYYSQDAIRFGWMVDSLRDGRTWMKRFGSYERDHSSQYRCRMAWHRLLEDHGLQYRYVDEHDLARGLDDVWLLVLPEVCAISSEELRGVLRFLDRGGRIVVDKSASSMRRALLHRHAHVMRGGVSKHLSRPYDRSPSSPFGRFSRVLAEARYRPPARVVVDADRGDAAIEVVRRPVGAAGTYYVFLRNLTPAEEDAMRPRDWRRVIAGSVVFRGAVKVRTVLEPAEDGSLGELRVDGDREAGRSFPLRVSAVCPTILRVEPTGR